VLTEALDRVQGAAAEEWIERDDASLVGAAKSGDRAAFGYLVARHERRVLFTALRITRNREDAEDVVQQSFQNAFIHLQEFEGRSSFSTWLTRIALNEALMLKRSNRRSREVPLEDTTATDDVKVMEIPDSSPNPESRLSESERHRLLLKAMKSLKPGIRAALQASDLDERSAKETARVLGLSVSAVKSRINRGRRVLRERLKRHMLPATVTHRRFSRAGRPLLGGFRPPQTVRVTGSLAR